MNDSDIRSFFMPGEKLLWSGRPAQGFLLFPSRSVLAFLGRFCDFLGKHCHQHGNADFHEIMGCPIRARRPVHNGRRFFVDAAARARTEYVVTDRRLIIRRSGLFRHFSTSQLELLPSLSLEEGSRGTGTIKFGCRPTGG
jgi:hypothetical protein